MNLAVSFVLFFAVFALGIYKGGNVLMLGTDIV